MQVWEASNGKRRLTYSGHSNPVMAVAWLPDRRLLASASRDRTVQVWEASSWQVAANLWWSIPGVVNAVAWSPDRASARLRKR